MLSAIQFDDQFLLETNEVYYVWAQELLAPELVPKELTTPNTRPQGLFGVGHTLSELTGALSIHHNPNE